MELMMENVVLQMTFSIYFSPLKIYIFWFTFSEPFAQGRDEQYASIGSNNVLELSKQQAIIFTNYGLLYWRIYVSPNPGTIFRCWQKWWQTTQAQYAGHFLRHYITWVKSTPKHCALSRKCALVCAINITVILYYYINSVRVGTIFV